MMSADSSCPLVLLGCLRNEEDAGIAEASPREGASYTVKATLIGLRATKSKVACWLSRLALS